MTNFEQLFKQISPYEMCDHFNEFTLTGKDFYAVTVGRAEHYNSMVGSGGGFGIFFGNPTVWCLFRQDRYTLELIKKEQTFTLSYFPDKYKQRMLFLGSKSGRGSDKMKEVELTGIQTPSEDIAFKEARLIIECQLTAIITPSAEDFYSQEAQAYIDTTYKNVNEYRKIVFGKITNVWVKKLTLSTCKK